MEQKKTRKFNIVDVIVLLIIIAAVALLGMKLLGDRGMANAEKNRIEYTVLVRAVHPDACATIMEYKDSNSQLMANGQLVDGYVTDISFETHLNYVDTADGRTVVTPDEGENARMDMTFTIQAAIDSPVTCKVGTQEVRIGKGHIVKTTDFELEGYSTTIMTRVDL